MLVERRIGMWTDVSGFDRGDRVTTTGTYNFDPALGSLVIDAFGNCGVRRTELTAQHMDDARFAANLITARWAAWGSIWWAVDLQTVALVQGQATYDVPATRFLFSTPI